MSGTFRGSEDCTRDDVPVVDAVVVENLISEAMDGGTHASIVPRSPRRRKISEDLENNPSPQLAGEQRNIAMPKPMKL